MPQCDDPHCGQTDAGCDCIEGSESISRKLTGGSFKGGTRDPPTTERPSTGIGATRADEPAEHICDCGRDQTWYPSDAKWDCENCILEERIEELKDYSDTMNERLCGALRKLDVAK